jgi:2-dehydro-3-deoxyphosphogluconate aldolase/(4S)-4-hydroxy-2-oxoglutarate aldolase
MLPTGGVSVATVEEYVLAGAAALGIGGELVDVAALQAAGGDGVVGAIAERARALSLALAAARAKLRGPAA